VLPYCYLGTIALPLHCPYVDHDPHKGSAMVLPWYYRGSKAEGRGKAGFGRPAWRGIRNASPGPCAILAQAERKVPNPI